MFPRIAILASVLLLSLPVVECLAAQPPFHPFSYQEGFEGQPPRVELWASSGKPTVTFLGPSEEQACEGRRALKLDVTLANDGYSYFGTRLKLPCEGKLTLSARILVAPGTTAHVGFGTNLVFPPTHHSGCGSCESFAKPTAGWKRVECDLVARGREGASHVMAGHAPTVQGDEVGAVLDRWAIFINGRAGQRAVVYLDDVRLEGQAPSQEDYRGEVERRWAKGRQRFERQLAALRADLAAGERGVAQQTAAAPAAAEAAAAERGVGADARARIDKIARRGYASRAELGDLQAACAALRYAPDTIQAVGRATAAGQPYLIYAPRAIANDRLSADTFPLPAPVAKGLACAGCRGEYEAVSAAVYALADVRGLRVSATELTGPGGTIPAAAVDVRVVKCWYQAAMDYAYQHGFGHVWNDFDHRKYRDHVFAYPTLNGVIDTIQWEGFREAVDDVRYLSTLARRIAACKEVAAKRALAEQADQWLAALAIDTDLDAMRRQAVEWILRLSK